ncbi:hypothetical protein Tco_1013056 [Tanacetum coccineum]
MPTCILCTKARASPAANLKYLVVIQATGSIMENVNALRSTHGHNITFDSINKCNSRVAEVEKQECTGAAIEGYAFSGLISNICVALRISLSKKRKLIAELEAVGDEEDVAKGLENLTVVVAAITTTLGDLDHFSPFSSRFAMKAAL